MLLQRTDCLHKGTLEVIADAHHFAGCLHLGGQCSLGGDKFIKGKPRQLDHTII